MGEEKMMGEEKVDGFLFVGKAGMSLVVWVW